jgi:hypothetical protein
MEFVYCDMKADNIVVHSVVEECRQIWLCDFGQRKSFRVALSYTFHEWDNSIDVEGGNQRKTSQCQFEDFIRGLLAFDPAKWMSALETLKSEWPQFLNEEIQDEYSDLFRCEIS